MNDVAIISTKTKIAVLLYLKKGKVSLQTAEMPYLFLSMSSYAAWGCGYSYCYSSCGFKCLILQKI